MTCTRRNWQMAVAALAIALGAGTTITYALLPSTTVPPATVAIGTLSGKTAINVLSADAFTRAIN